MERRIYFRNLNGLRFLAATLVIFHHIEQYKFWSQLPNNWGNTSIDAMGHKAVSFFFVLSGFLITYLLLVENRESGNIDIKKFYMRRVLRIWPLYYLIVLLSFFAVPLLVEGLYPGIPEHNAELLLTFICLLLILPNVVRLFNPYVIGGNQLWSIGVEEQFYVIWPVLVRLFRKHLLAFLLIFVGLKLSITLLVDVFANTRDFSILAVCFRFWKMLQIEQMAIGAIGAWLLFHKKGTWLKAIYHRFTYVMCLIFVGMLFVFPAHHWIINYGEALVFVVLIMNLSTNPNIKFSMESPLLVVLGNISYGIYMYHTLCIAFCLFALRSFGIEHTHYALFNILLYTSSVVMTMAIAYMSYEFFEKRILKYKETFALVNSGKNVEETRSWPAARKLNLQSEK